MYRIYVLKDVREYIKRMENEDGLFIPERMDSLTNFARVNLTRDEMLYDINDPHVAAFGTFSIAYNFEGSYDSINHQITINKIYEIINDGFDFTNEQRLGAWQKSIFSPYAPVEWLTIINSNKLNLSNSAFRSFRTKTNIGEDFRIRYKREKEKFIQTIQLYDDGTEYK